MNFSDSPPFRLETKTIFLKSSHYLSAVDSTLLDIWTSDSGGKGINSHP